MPAVQGKRVVIIGDSLSAGSNTPGGQLGAQLIARGADVEVNARSGRSAYSFFSRENGNIILSGLQAFKPQLAIVVLGTNDIGLDMNTDAKAMAKIRDAFQNVGAEVWAIGPPMFESTSYNTGAEAVIAMEKTVFGSDRFIDARPLTPQGLHSPDGVHFTPEGGKVLGKKLAGAFAAAGVFSWAIGLAVVAGAWLLFRRR